MSQKLYKNSYFILVSLLLITTGFTSCISYSFTGASIPPEAKTISIDYIDNQAQLVVPTLSESFTTSLRDRFTSQTSLELVNNNGDLQIEGVITDYNTTPQAITGNETAALNRLTVTVKIKFVNTIEPDKNYETTFSRYEDYDSGQDLSSVQDGLIETINEMLIDDIFNKAVVNW